MFLTNIELPESIPERGFVSEKTAQSIADARKRLGKIQKGDYLQLGQYMCSEGCYPPSICLIKPIDWVVIKKEGNRLLLLTAYNLNWRFFDGSASFFADGNDMTWAESTIREELNNEFLTNSFTPMERQLICPVRITTPDNPIYHTKGGQDSFDRVFLPSLDELLDWFPHPNGKYPDPDLLRSATPMVDPVYDHDAPGHINLEMHLMPWWLRTPGEFQNMMAVVSYNGYILLDGIDNGADEVGIRPAMWIDLNVLDNYI